jgi:hypothetical protein
MPRGVALARAQKPFQKDLLTQQTHFRGQFQPCDAETLAQVKTWVTLFESGRPTRMGGVA